jgi:peptidoglycan/LPS O-acetylase OafA/YrhL
MKRFESIDAWRGLACIMVVLFHSVFKWESVDSNLGFFCEIIIWLTKQMWIGVPIFFVISGYCISHSVDSLLDKQFQFGEYMYRRFKRIYPPYLAMILILTLLSFVEKMASSNVLSGNGGQPILPPWWRTGWEIFGNLTLTEVWRHHLIGTPRRMSMIVGVAWTLCYEEQFYLLMGLIARFAGRRYFWRGVAGVTLVTIPFFGNGVIKGFFFDGYWLMFALGALVYYAIRYKVPMSSVLSIAMISICFALGYSMNRVGFGEVNDLSLSLIVSTVFAIVLVWQYKKDEFFQQIGLSKMLNWFGLRCYSLYLVHFPITCLISFWNYEHFGFQSSLATVFVTLPMCLLFSSLAASVFFNYIEKQFLNTRRHLACKAPSS